MSDISIKVTLPGGTTYDISVQSTDLLSALRLGMEAVHELPPACILKLFQNGMLLLDDMPVSDVDVTQPVFGVVARETKLEVLLQACGSWRGYQELLRTSHANATDTKLIQVGPMPSIIDVIEDFAGQAVEIPNLRKSDGTLAFSGDSGALLLPSLDVAELTRLAGAERFTSVTMCIEVNSDAYNRGLGVVLEASPLMEATVDEHGLPMYVYNGYGISADKKQSAVKFHPGMGGGMLRIEGAGGFHNQNVGFTPQNWTESGNKLHVLEITLNATGENEICLRGTGGEEWRKPFIRQLTAGRYLPAIYAWLDLGSEANPLHVGSITAQVSYK